MDTHNHLIHLNNIIIGQGLAKYGDFSVTSRTIICQRQRLRQIICETLTNSNNSNNNNVLW